jgi:hypothetical protein
MNKRIMIMFYFLLILILLFAIMKNVFWLIVVSLLALSVLLICRLFLYAIFLIIEFIEMIPRKRKDSGIKIEKIYDKTDPYWEWEKALDEFNKSFNTNLQK